MKGLTLFTILMIPILIIVGLVLIVALGLVIFDPGILLPFLISPKKKNVQEMAQQPVNQTPEQEAEPETKKKEKEHCEYKICADDKIYSSQTDTCINLTGMYPHGKKASWDETDTDIWSETEPDRKEETVIEQEPEESDCEKELQRAAKQQAELIEEMEEEEERMLENLDDMILEAALNEDYE